MLPATQSSCVGAITGLGLPLTLVSSVLSLSPVAMATFSELVFWSSLSKRWPVSFQSIHGLRHRLQDTHLSLAGVLLRVATAFAAPDHAT